MPSRVIASGSNRCPALGNATATEFNEATSKAASRLVGVSTTRAAMISAQFGTHLGGRDKRVFSSLSNSVSGVLYARLGSQSIVQASTRTTDDAPAPRMENNRCQPHFKFRLPRIKCVISTMSSATRITRQTPTSHGGKMMKCTVCAASTGPLQLNEYAT